MTSKVLIDGSRGSVEKEQGEHDAPAEHVQPPSQDRDQVQVSTNKETVALFKLGFGGRIVLSPGAYDYLSTRSCVGPTRR